jgi:hypothetical protein
MWDFMAAFRQHDRWKFRKAVISIRTSGLFKADA